MKNDKRQLVLTQLSTVERKPQVPLAEEKLAMELEKLKKKKTKK